MWKRVPPCSDHTPPSLCVKWIENLNEFLGESLPLGVNFSSSCPGHSWIFHYMHFIKVHALRFRARGCHPAAPQIPAFLLICCCVNNKALHVWLKLSKKTPDSVALCFVYSICSQYYYSLKVLICKAWTHYHSIIKVSLYNDELYAQFNLSLCVCLVSTPLAIFLQAFIKLTPWLCYIHQPLNCLTRKVKLSV